MINSADPALVRHLYLAYNVQNEHFLSQSCSTATASSSEPFSWTKISRSSVSEYCGNMACRAITFFCISSVMAPPLAPNEGLAGGGVVSVWDDDILVLCKVDDRGSAMDNQIVLKYLTIKCHNSSRFTSS